MPRPSPRRYFAGELIDPDAPLADNAAPAPAAAAGDSAGLTEEKLAARKGPPAHAARGGVGVGSGGKEHRPADASDKTALPRGRRGARDWPRARAGLPPLLVPVSARRPEPLHYIGVSYGITAELFRFWKRAGSPPPPPPSRTKWTRRVPRPVLIGHAASPTPY